LWVETSQAAEKDNSKPLLVALLPVLVLLPISSVHSQEWLCYSTFSANCSAATFGGLDKEALAFEVDLQSVPGVRMIISANQPGISERFA